MHGDQRYRSASGDLVLADVRGSLDDRRRLRRCRDRRGRPVNDHRPDGVRRPRACEPARSPSCSATTTSGDLRVSGRFDGDGPFAIETVSGDGTLAPVNDVRVEAKTITGDIDSDRPSRRDDTAGHRVLAIGAGGPTITFRSASGDLRVVAAYPAHTSEAAKPCRATHPGRATAPRRARPPRRRRRPTTTPASASSANSSVARSTSRRPACASRPWTSTPIGPWERDDA